jgi:hypothetical protein
VELVFAGWQWAPLVLPPGQGGHVRVVAQFVIAGLDGAPQAVDVAGCEERIGAAHLDDLIVAARGKSPDKARGASEPCAEDPLHAILKALGTVEKVLALLLE